MCSVHAMMVACLACPPCSKRTVLHCDIHVGNRVCINSHQYNLDAAKRGSSCHRTKTGQSGANQDYEEQAAEPTNLEVL